MTRPTLEMGIAVTGGAIGATGAALIEPMVIAAALVLVGVSLAMRVTDQRAKQEQRAVSRAASPAL